MGKAIALSQKMMRAGKGGPFGAVVVRKGKIIATGHNQVTSTNDPTAHAEIVAIREACKKLKTFQLDDCELPLQRMQIHEDEYAGKTLRLHDGPRTAHRVE